MSPRRREGHFLLLREGIYLPAPPLHLGTGHDLHKRYLSVSLRWWNTISSQRVPHRSAGVREGKQRTSLQECQKQDWLRSAGSTWSCGDVEESPIFQLRGSFHVRELFPHLFQQFTVYWAVFLYVYDIWETSALVTAKSLMCHNSATDCDSSRLKKSFPSVLIKDEEKRWAVPFWLQQKVTSQDQTW